MHFAILLTSLLLVQLTPRGEAAPTTGTEFLFAFPCMGNTANLNIYVTNANTASASLSIYSSDPNFDPMDQEVDSQSTLQIPFYDPDLQACDKNVVSQKGLLIQSSLAVSVYVDIEDSSGTRTFNFLVLPTNVLGKQYGFNYYQGYNLHLLVALQDNTQVTVGTSPTPINLNRLETYLIYSYSNPNMTSNNPVALIFNYQTDASMALPNIYKATEFPIVPHPNTSVTLVIVLAFEEHTYVIVNGVTQNMINAGAWLSFSVAQPSIITTSRRAQVMTGSSNGDQPASQVVPQIYFLSSASVPFRPMAHIPYNSRDPIHTLEIIAPTASVGQIAVDGTTVPALQYKRISTSSYYYALLPVSGDQHVLTTSSAGLKFTASVYTGYYNSQYANARFNIGLDLPLATRAEQEI